MTVSGTNEACDVEKNRRHRRSTHSGSELKLVLHTQLIGPLILYHASLKVLNTFIYINAEPPLYHKCCLLLLLLLFIIYAFSSHSCPSKLFDPHSVRVFLYKLAALLLIESLKLKAIFLIFVRRSFG